MPAPTTPPLGLQLAGTAKVVRRAFDEALVAVGGSLPVWLILIAAKRSPQGSQRDLAAAVGITGATLTHHLDAMETDGLLVRRRDPDNRRVQRVELTPEGEAAFRRLRGAATGFDRRLRRGLTTQEGDQLAALLRRLESNIVATADPS